MDVDRIPIKLVNGPAPDSSDDPGGIEQGLDNIANGGLNGLYGGNASGSWDEATPMTGSHIPGVDTGARGGQTTFMGDGGRMETAGSGGGSFGGNAPGGSTPYESMLRDHLLGQLPPDKTGTEAAQGTCTGNVSGYIDSSGRLNVCVYGGATPATSLSPQSEDTLSAGDVIGSGMATYSMGMGQLLEKNGVTVASRFGIQYGLPGLAGDLPGAVGGAIGLGETYAAYQRGDNHEAFKDGGGTVFSLVGAEAGAGVGATVGAIFPPAEVVAPLIGALLGGIGGGAFGRWVGNHAYEKIAPEDRTGKLSNK